LLRLLLEYKSDDEAAVVSLDSEVAPVVDHSHLPVASDQTHRPAEAEEADESSEPPEELLEYEVEELEEELDELDEAEFLDPEFL